MRVERVWDVFSAELSCVIAPVEVLGRGQQVPPISAMCVCACAWVTADGGERREPRRWRLGCVVRRHHPLHDHDGRRRTTAPAMPDPPQPKRDRNLASLRLARATSIDTTRSPLAPARRPLSPASSQGPASAASDVPLTRALSHQPSTAAGPSKPPPKTSRRTERWVEAASEFELPYEPPPGRRLTSGMRKSFAIDEADDDEAEDDGKPELLAAEEEDEVDRLGERRGVTFADEDTVELLPDDGMRLEEFERPRGREMFAIVTSCAVLAVLSLTAGFATVYDWVL